MLKLNYVKNVVKYINTLAQQKKYLKKINIRQQTYNRVLKFLVDHLWSWKCGKDLFTIQTNLQLALWHAIYQFKLQCLFCDIFHKVNLFVCIKTSFRINPYWK